MATILLDKSVARGEKNEERVDLRAPTSWLVRVENAARKKGLGVSAYIRMVVAERMDMDGETREEDRPKKKSEK